MLEKIFYKGIKRLFPSEIKEGQVLYAEDENGLYLDNENTRDRLNPPADWEETDQNSPSYIANKPEIDDTLTVSGAVADAKAVGDEMADLKGALNELDEEIDDLKGDLSEAESWKQSGQEGELLSKDSEGELTWISLDDIRDEIANINKRVNLNSVKLYSSDTSMIWLENVGTNVDVISLIDQGDENTSVRITGFDNTVSSVQDIVAFYDNLDTMNGITAQGDIVEGQAQVSGILRTGYITNEKRVELENRYGDIQIIADKSNEQLLDDLVTSLDDGTYVNKYHVGDIIPIQIDDTYYNTVVMAVDTDVDADNNTIPLTLGTVDLVGTMQMNTTDTNSGGWASSKGRTTVAEYVNKLPNELQDRLVPAKKYSVIYGDTEQITYDKLWIPSNKELGFTSNQESSNTVYSGIYTDNTSRIKKRNNTSSGYWTRTTYTNGTSEFNAVESGGINGHTYTSNSLGIALCFCLGADPEIKAWNDLKSSIQNGTYATDYSVGDELPYTTTDGETYHAVIVGFDKDVDANDRTIPVTMITEELWKTAYPMNSTATNAGGWNASVMRTSTMPAIKAKLPKYVTTNLVSAKKYSLLTDRSTQQTIDDVWIPNHYEMGFTGYETSGPTYNGVFTNDASRIKKLNGIITSYHNRTAYPGYSTHFHGVTTDGAAGGTKAEVAYTFPLGFCLG